MLVGNVFLYANVLCINKRNTWFFFRTLQKKNDDQPGIGLKNTLIMLLFQEWDTQTALPAAANPEIATTYVCQPKKPDHHHHPKNFNISIETCFDSCSLFKLNNKSAVSVISDIFSTTVYLENSLKLAWSGIVRT